MTPHQPRRVLVTGGAGFIGSNYVRHLLKTDAHLRVVTLDALTYAGRKENLDGLEGGERHTFVRGNICDGPLVKDVFRRHSIDTVVHFAAESHVDRSITGPAAFIDTNVVGTLSLLEVAREEWATGESRRFHHVSTDEVFGSLGRDDPPFDEETAYKPNSPYSASKAASDHLVRAYAHTYGLPVTLSNCSNNFGPFQHPEKFIPTVIRACIQQRPIPIYGDGSNRRDWLFVTDHCAAIDAVVRTGDLGQTYCVGGGTEEANLEIATLVCSIMDRLTSEAKPHARLLTYVKDRLGHDWRYAVDATKIKEELGWAPAHSFASALEETIQWYLTRASAESVEP